LPLNVHFRTLKGMEMHINSELQARLEQMVIETGRPADELVEDALAGYLEELSSTRQMLDNRYDDLKSGRVQPMEGEEAFARLIQNTEAQAKRQ